jgi:hypothetical protein
MICSLPAAYFYSGRLIAASFYAHPIGCAIAPNWWSACLRPNRPGASEECLFVIRIFNWIMCFSISGVLASAASSSADVVCASSV